MTATNKVYRTIGGAPPAQLVRLAQRREWFARQLERHIPGISELQAAELLTGAAYFDSTGRLHYDPDSGRVDI